MKISIQQIEEAEKRLKDVVIRSPLQFSKRMSEKFGANVYVKREDMQEVRSYKIRGAYNKMASLSDDERQRGVVAASAGNHAQGVAFSCSHLKIKGTIFMPIVTPQQKIDRVKHFGGKYVEVQLVGQTYDESAHEAHKYGEEKNMVYIHAFNDPLTIAGQGTVGKEIIEQLPNGFDIFVAPIGGGGFISGTSEYIKQIKPDVKIFGAEPENAASMAEAIKAGKVVTLEKIDTFVDGAAVQRVGDLTFEICQKNLGKVLIVPVGRICKTMIDLYQNEGIISEPAGALSIAALSSIRDEIKGKTVVCVLSGSNNDILRYPEIFEKSLVYQGRKHYFIIEFAQKPGQLRKFLDEALGSNDDIVRFEYMKKTNKEKGAALVGIELKNKSDLEPLLERLKQAEFNFHKLSSKELLYDYII
ncbi:MAG TPA: threonine ammonia-lyase IlvA [Patescibacteria group bacterium]|nr:threonine ammonia-lyase IlvA [Patescibacteria group bacterium]